MTALLLADGGPLTVESLDVRIGAGPWACWLATAAVPDESTHRAERGRRLARTGAVGAVRVAEGRLTARVTGSTGNEYDVSLGADPVRSTAWDAAVRATRGRSALQAAAAGEVPNSANRAYHGRRHALSQTLARSLFSDENPADSAPGVSRPPVQCRDRFRAR